MEAKLIQYRAKPEAIAENEQLIREVFAQLHERRVEGVRYAVLRQDDGTFTHLVVPGPDGTTAALTSLPAFQRFQSGVRERCAVLPATAVVQVVGNYGMLADEHRGA
jgi:hypothetical protein